MSKGLESSFSADIWDPEETSEVKTLEGWLEKRGEKGVFLKGKKKRRFFRTFMDDGIPVLFYYETDNIDSAAKGSIDFRSGTLNTFHPFTSNNSHGLYCMRARAF